MILRTLVLFLMLSTSVGAQLTVSGVVTDPDLKGLENVKVSFIGCGTSVSALTDAAGDYDLFVPRCARFRVVPVKFGYVFKSEEYIVFFQSMDTQIKGLDFIATPRWRLWKR